VTALQFYKTVTADKSNFLERLLKLLDDQAIHYCVIGDVAVSAFVEPVLGLDFDMVVTDYQLGRFESLVAHVFTIKRQRRLLEITAPQSRLTVNVHTDSRYIEFVTRAEMRPTLDLQLPVARLQDVLQEKIDSSQEPTRPAWKRLKDLSDIMRLLEAHPKLRAHMPPNLLAKFQAIGAPLA